MRPKICSLTCICYEAAVTPDKKNRAQTQNPVNSKHILINALIIHHKTLYQVSKYWLHKFTQNTTHKAVLKRQYHMAATLRCSRCLRARRIDCTTIIAPQYYVNKESSCRHSSKLVSERLGKIVQAHKTQPICPHKRKHT